MLLTPDKTDLLAFFQSEPMRESRVEDGLYIYRMKDQTGITLFFSFDEIESSIQVRLKLGENDIAQVCQEGATRLTFQNDAFGNYLCCDFDKNAVISNVKIRVEPHIAVNWSTLMN